MHHLSENISDYKSAFNGTIKLSARFARNYELCDKTVSNGAIVLNISKELAILWYLYIFVNVSVQVEFSKLPAWFISCLNKIYGHLDFNDNIDIFRENVLGFPKQISKSEHHVLLPIAANNLGVLYDYFASDECQKWFEYSAFCRNSIGMKNLALFWIKRGKFIIATKWLAYSVLFGSKDSMELLEAMLSASVASTYIKALQGDLESIYHIARMYDSGSATHIYYFDINSQLPRGILADLDTAIEFYSHAVGLFFKSGIPIKKFDFLTYPYQPIILMDCKIHDFAEIKINECSVDTTGLNYIDCFSKILENLFELRDTSNMNPHLKGVYATCCLNLSTILDNNLYPTENSSVLSCWNTFLAAALLQV